MPVSPFERAAREGLIGGNSNNSTIEDGRRRGRRPDVSGDWAPTFLDAVMRGATNRIAARAAGIDLTLPYKRRQNDKAFAAAWREAGLIGTELMECEAARRAYHGTLKPVFYKGVQCGVVREYSDTLMIFLLKARKPEVYREGVEDNPSRLPTTINVNVVNVDASRVGVNPQEVGGVPVLLEVVSAGQDGREDDQGVREAAPVP